MSWNQIVVRWRATLVTKLQHRYGLSEDEAKRKTESWFDWLKAQPGSLTAERSKSDPTRRAPDLTPPDW
jgi:hypothetical protein